MCEEVGWLVLGLLGCSIYTLWVLLASCRPSHWSIRERSGYLAASPNREAGTALHLLSSSCEVLVHSADLREQWDVSNVFSLLLIMFFKS